MVVIQFLEQSPQLAVAVVVQAAVAAVEMDSLAVQAVAVVTVAELGLLAQPIKVLRVEMVQQVYQCGVVEVVVLVGLELLAVEQLVLLLAVIRGLVLHHLLQEVL